MISKLPNATVSIFSKMSHLAQQHDALNLSQGFPSFKVDQQLKDFYKQAIEDDDNQYTLLRGLLDLRLGIKDFILQTQQVAYNVENEIVVTAGATQAINTAIQATIHKDDEVIIFTPAYDSYAPSVQLAGGKVIAVPMSLPDFTIDWQQVQDLITSRTRMIITNSPHNPSGAVLTDADMQQLESIVVKNNLFLVSDEVYGSMTFDDVAHLSACRYPQLKERSFVIGSFGKTFHITGWKVGYCLAPQHLMDEFLKVHQQVVFCINHPAQKAIAQYLNNKDNYLKLPQFYQRKRDLFLSQIKNSRFKFSPAMGSYYQLLDYSAITDMNDEQYAIELTKKHKLATIPISVFMNGADPKMLRLCLAKEDHELIAAAHILNSL